jgi:hypothetical protein
METYEKHAEKGNISSGEHNKCLSVPKTKYALQVYVLLAEGTEAQT